MKRISPLCTTVALTLSTLAVSGSGAGAQDSLTVTYQGDAVTSGPPLTIAALKIEPAAVTGGAAATGTVRFEGVRLRRHDEIELSSSDPAVAKVPATVTIPVTGTLTFTIETSRVAAPRAVEITVRKNGERTATLTVRPPLRLVSLRLEPSSAAPGDRVTGTVELNLPALVDTSVLLTSSHPLIVGVPATVAVPARATSASFPVTLLRPLPLPGAVTIRAEMRGGGGSQTLEATLAIGPRERVNP